MLEALSTGGNLAHLQLQPIKGKRQIIVEDY